MHGLGKFSKRRSARVNVRRHGIFIPANPSRLLPRLMHEISFPISLMRSLFHRRRFDVVMVYCPLLGSVAFAAVRKLFYREPLWVNVQDIPAEAAVASGIIHSKLFHCLGAGLQRLLFSRGEVWSSISPEMVSELKAIGAAKQTVHFCPNWLTGSLSEQVGLLSCKIGRCPHNPVNLLYCGTIGKKQGLLEFCRRLATSNLDFRFRIQGAGSEAAAVREWVHARGDARFAFDGLLPEAEFVKAIHATDWFVISENSGVGSSFLPSKLIPCISTATPVLAIADESGPLGQEVADNEVGIVIPWPQLEQLPARLISFYKNPVEFETLQRNCARRAEMYRRDTAIDRIEKLLRTHCRPDSAAS